MGLEILERSETPDGVKIQLESWDGEYAIGAYPKAVNDFGWMNKKGKTFRLGLQRNMPDNDKVKVMYESLIKGTSELKQYENQFWSGDMDRYALGLIDEEPRGTGYGTSYKHSDEGTPYEFRIEINGENIYFGYDGKRTIKLFGGGMEITYPKPMSFEDVVADIKTNYQKYKDEDTIATYEAYGFYD